MKTLITFTFLLFSIFSQIKEVPFTDANVIKIQTTLNEEELFNKWTEYLAQNGFPIAESDTNLLSFRTRGRNTLDLGYEYKLFSSIEENGVIQIKIEYRINANQETKTPFSEFKEWKYSENNKDINKIIFNEVYEIISSFGEYKIYFEKNTELKPPLDS